jgi:hypothetical protein
MCLPPPNHVRTRYRLKNPARTKIYIVRQAINFIVDAVFPRLGNRSVPNSWPERRTSNAPRLRRPLSSPLRLMWPSILHRATRALPARACRSLARTNLFHRPPTAASSTTTMQERYSLELRRASPYGFEGQRRHLRQRYGLPAT